MRDYYEDLWQRLPAGVTGPDYGLRREFMLACAQPGDRALDLGCGEGSLTAELKPAVASVIGADVAQAAIRRAQERHPGLEFVRVALDGELPFPDAAFDLVWASEVIEHVADTARWLSEARRVLAPRGRLALTTPSHGRLRLALGGIERYSEPLGDHLHLYSKRSLRSLLEEFGLAPVEVRSAGGWPPLRRLLLARGVR